MSDKKSSSNRFEANYFYQFRVILIGDSTVGKSSLLRQFTEGQFIQTSDPTVGVDFHVRIIELNGTYVSCLSHILKNVVISDKLLNSSHSKSMCL